MMTSWHGDEHKWYPEPVNLVENPSIVLVVTDEDEFVTKKLSVYVTLCGHGTTIDGGDGELVL